MPRTMSLAAAAAFGAALASSHALAADAPASVTKGPPESAFRASWPASARAKDLGGRAVARCKVSAAGALSDCAIVLDSPAGEGFGAALLTMTQGYSVKPAIKDGAPVESTVLLSGYWYHWDKAAEWVRKPTSADLLAVWPKEAARKGIAGGAILNCLLTPQGALADCFVDNEWPEGQHFGQAALAMAPQFLFKPASREGKPVPSVLRIPINFKGGQGFDSGGPGSAKLADAAMIWPAAPTYKDVADAYPAKARAEKVAGRATLFCRFRPDGTLFHCDTVSEAPTGLGFAKAAHALSEKFRAFTATPAGTSIRDIAIQLPITFDPAMLDEGQAVVGKPQWALLPQESDVSSAFEKTPKNLGTVRVMLNCVVAQAGSVEDCAVESETPAGQGYGAAALALAKLMRLSTWTMEGLPVVGGSLRIPIRYESGPPAAAPAEAKP